MAKVKLLRFEIVSLISESKRLMDYIQKLGIADIENIEDEELIKCDTSAAAEQYRKKYDLAQKAISILENNCGLKRSMLESFTDFKQIEYSEYRVMADKADATEALCKDIVELNSKVEDTERRINEEKRLIDFYSPWDALDIPMASKRTMTTNIYVGTLGGFYNSDQIIKIINDLDPDLNEIAVEVISSEKLQTCVVVIAHQSVSGRTENALRQMGFVVSEKPAQALPSKAMQNVKVSVSEMEEEIVKLKASIKGFADNYDDFRFLSDYASAQAEKYVTFDNTAQTEKTFVIRGYLPEVMSEETKFEIENKFICQMDLSEPDYENADVPVLIKNGSFAGGVESITNMYSSPSNKDIDPNPIMAFFYYVFFGFMLSDAGYGVLMLIFSLFAKKKVKVTGSNLKFVNMVFYCGISTVFWGTMFGGWFGDLIPTVCTNFLGYDTGPNLAVWMDPVSNSMTLLLFCLGFGIIQLFAGVLINGYLLLKKKEYVGAVCDTVPVMVFVMGFAILGGSLIAEIPQWILPWGTRLLAVGAVLIILTAGRNSKNIIGKLGGGLYALYNVTTGYVGDILSYSRLLALSLVTGVVANAVNLLSTMPGNIIAFAVIFVIGHTINFAINIIGTYVHTNRLQYVEFFSKFYEGSGRCFTPFKINSKYFIVKEEKKYD